MIREIVVINYIQSVSLFRYNNMTLHTELVSLTYCIYLAAVVTKHTKHHFMKYDTLLSIPNQSNYNELYLKHMQHSNNIYIFILLLCCD